jgi:hypothetical protein
MKERLAYQQQMTQAMEQALMAENAKKDLRKQKTEEMIDGIKS